MRWVVVACVSAILAWPATQARADQAQDEAAIKALNVTFAAAMVAKDSVKRASIWEQEGTLLPPNAGYVTGRLAIEKHFDTEAPEFTADSEASFSNYRFDFVTRNLAFVDADLTVRNILGPDQKLLAVASVKVVFLAERRQGKWWVRDERAHYAPQP